MNNEPSSGNLPSNGKIIEINIDFINKPLEFKIKTSIDYPLKDNKGNEKYSNIYNIDAKCIDVCPVKTQGNIVGGTPHNAVALENINNSIDDACCGSDGETECSSPSEECISAGDTSYCYRSGKNGIIFDPVCWLSANTVEGSLMGIKGNLYGLPGSYRGKGYWDAGKNSVLESQLDFKSTEDGFSSHDNMYWGEWWDSTFPGSLATSGNTRYINYGFESYNCLPLSSNCSHTPITNPYYNSLHGVIDGYNGKTDTYIKNIKQDCTPRGNHIERDPLLTLQRGKFGVWSNKSSNSNTGSDYPGSIVEFNNTTKWNYNPVWYTCIYEFPTNKSPTSSETLTTFYNWFDNFSPEYDLFTDSFLHFSDFIRYLYQPINSGKVGYYQYRNNYFLDFFRDIFTVNLFIKSWLTMLYGKPSSLPKDSLSIILENVQGQSGGVYSKLVNYTTEQTPNYDNIHSFLKLWYPEIKNTDSSTKIPLNSLFNSTNFSENLKFKYIVDKDNNIYLQIPLSFEDYYNYKTADINYLVKGNAKSEFKGLDGLLNFTGSNTITQCCGTEYKNILPEISDASKNYPDQILQINFNNDYQTIASQGKPVNQLYNYTTSTISYNNATNSLNSVTNRLKIISDKNNFAGIYFKNGTFNKFVITDLWYREDSGYVIRYNTSTKSWKVIDLLTPAIDYITNMEKASISDSNGKPSTNITSGNIVFLQSGPKPLILKKNINDNSGEVCWIPNEMNSDNTKCCNITYEDDAEYSDGKQPDIYQCNKIDLNGKPSVNFIPLVTVKIDKFNPSLAASFISTVNNGNLTLDQNIYKTILCKIYNDAHLFPLDLFQWCPDENSTINQCNSNCSINCSPENIPSKSDIIIQNCGSMYENSYFNGSSTGKNISNIFLQKNSIAGDTKCKSGIWNCNCWNSQIVPESAGTQGNKAGICFSLACSGNNMKNALLGIKNNVNPDSVCRNYCSTMWSYLTGKGSAESIQNRACFDEDYFKKICGINAPNDKKYNTDIIGLGITISILSAFISYIFILNKGGSKFTAGFITSVIVVFLCILTWFLSTVLIGTDFCYKYGFGDKGKSYCQSKSSLNWKIPSEFCEYKQPCECEANDLQCSKDCKCLGSLCSNTTNNKNRSWKINTIYKNKIVFAIGLIIISILSIILSYFVINKYNISNKNLATSLITINILIVIICVIIYTTFGINKKQQIEFTEPCS